MNITVYIVGLVILLMLSIFTIIMWSIFKNKKIIKTKQYYVIPLIFIFIITFMLGQKVIMDVDTIETTRKLNNDKLLQDKWQFFENTLQNLINENYILSETLGNDIINELNKIPQDQLQVYLDTLGKDHHNKIQQIIGNRLKNIYFRNFVNDANDPFAMIIKKGFDDSFIFTDYSENCSVDELTRNLYIEFEMQGKKGNKNLAQETFYRIVNLDSGKSLYESLFFQFEAPDPRSKPLESYDFMGLKYLYFKNNGDLWITLKSYEFLAPFYIYKDKSITGIPRVDNRIKTGAPIIAIISVFSPYEILINDTVFKNSLNDIENTQNFIYNTSLKEERIILITGIICMVITGIMFILFWMYTHYFNINLIKNNNE